MHAVLEADERWEYVVALHDADDVPFDAFWSYRRTAFGVDILTIREVSMEDLEQPQPLCGISVWTGRLDVSLFVTDVRSLRQAKRWLEPIAELQAAGVSQVELPPEPRRICDVCGDVVPELAECPTCGCAFAD